MRGLRTRRAKDRVPGAHKAATDNLHEIIVYKWTSCPVSLLLSPGRTCLLSCLPSFCCLPLHKPPPPAFVPLQTSCSAGTHQPPRPSGQRYGTIGAVFFTAMWAKRSGESPSSGKTKQKQPTQTAPVLLLLDEPPGVYSNETVITSC